MSHPRVESRLRGWLRGGCASCLWISPPPNSGDEASANAHLVRIVRAAISRGTPIIIEGPSKANWWGTFDFLVQLGARSIDLDHCQWGGRFCRPTALLTLNLPDNLDLCQKCLGSKGLCSASGRAHIPLRGRSLADGQPWARLARALPWRLAR